MKKLSKLLALVLVLSMVIGALPITVSAASYDGYTDVDAGASYAEAIKILTQAGIMSGIGDGQFGPDLTVTRAQAITVLGRLAGVAQEETDDFADVEAGSWYAGYVGWAVENGIVVGDGQGNFMPDANVTSEHLNLMLSRYTTLIGGDYTFYDTGAATVARAELAQRLAQFLTSPEVAVTGGMVKGYLDKNGVATYKGIPYAAPTSGENRWKDPQPVEAWEGVKACTEFGDITLQPTPVPFMWWTDEYIDVGMSVENGKISEDSLNLNVWTQGAKGDKLPVIVYIHGGANTSGSGCNEIYTGENIAQKGVVYVSINYRVGPFGFLACKDETGESTGNFALKDQIAALNWIQENIAIFGGDPSNVTIVGQSAGSSNVQMLIASPAAKGLFGKAVAMSFNNYDPKASYTTLEDAQKEAAEKLKELGHTMAELRDMSTDEVYKLLDSLPNSGYVLDSKYVTQTLAEAYQNGSYNHVDLLCGGVTGDTMLFDGDASSMMEGYYTAAVAKNASDPEHKTYVYYFSHPVPDQNSELASAFHTGDVSYWLNYYSSTSNRPWTDVDYALGEAMSNYLVNFATTGDPNGEGLPVWTDTDSAGEFTYMEFGETPEMVTPSQAS